MFNFFSKVFGRGHEEADHTQETACESILLAVSQVINDPSLKCQTRMTGILGTPYVRKYLAGTFLNVLCFYARRRNIAAHILKIEGLLDVLCQRLGNDCRKGYNQVEDIGDSMRSSGAPLPDSVPEASQSIVAETCISQIIFQGKLPEKEYDIFRKVYFESVKTLCSQYLGT